MGSWAYRAYGKEGKEAAAVMVHVLRLVIASQATLPEATKPSQRIDLPQIYCMVEGATPALFT